MSMKHTPGPWNLQPNGAAYNLCHSDNDQTFGLLVGMQNMVEGEHEANARLIIRAPELQEERDALLAACKAAVEDATQFGDDPIDLFLPETTLTILTTAIAKAEGK